MPPIIRRTITITITEKWTITWQDGQETVWQETHEEITWPAISELDPPLAPVTNSVTNDEEDHEEGNDIALDGDAADQRV